MLRLQDNLQHCMTVKVGVCDLTRVLMVIRRHWQDMLVGSSLAPLGSVGQTCKASGTSQSLELGAWFAWALRAAPFLPAESDKLAGREFVSRSAVRSAPECGEAGNRHLTRPLEISSSCIGGGYGVITTRASGTALVLGGRLGCAPSRCLASSASTSVLSLRLEAGVAASGDEMRPQTQSFSGLAGGR